MHTHIRKKAKQHIFFNFLLAMLLMHVLITLTSISSVSSETQPLLAAPSVSDETLVPGSSFTIDITIADVHRLFGYQFVLFYDTNVLTIADTDDFGSYEPFTSPWPYDLNETGGYVYMSFSFPFGEETGVTTVDPKPIAWIKFLVDTKGSSTLHLSDTGLIDVDGGPIPHDSEDGLFSNVAFKVSVSPQMRTAIIGDTFSIEITVTEVENLWGFHFVLGYNTTVLNSTGYSSYEPFTVEGSPSQINETAGYVFMNYSMTVGEPTGFTTVDPKPIAKISFVVNINGSTPLDLQNSTFININGDTLPHQVVDGFFSNVHDIAVSSVAAFPSLVSAGQAVTVVVTLENKGDFPETFNLTARYDSYEIETRQVTDLAPGVSTTLNFTWGTGDVSEGSYLVTVEAPLSSDVNPDDNKRTAGSVRIRGGALGDVNLLYALAVGVAVSVGVVVGVQRFKIKKKSRPPQHRRRTSSLIPS